MVLLTACALLSDAGNAGAAASRLTPTPPVPLQQPAPPRPSPTPSTDVIPRTGTDLPEQMLTAAALILGGAALRTRRLSGRR